MNDFIRRITMAARKRVQPSGAIELVPFKQYDATLPTNQNAIDLLPGWSTALPAECGVTAGHMATYSDMRMIWATECFGSLEGKRVLELGPLEAGHTIYLDKMGADVLGIESNKLAFLRCLVVKELVRLARARFMLGDFVKWLDTTEERYDLIVASGVLYHMHEPLRLLDLIAKRADAVYFWTHYVDDAAMPIGDPRRAVLADRADIVDFHGKPMRLYKRTYANAAANDSFNGGIVDAHNWMHRDDILTALRALGYLDIRISQETPDHQNGPAFSVFASKAARTS